MSKKNTTSTTGAAKKKYVSTVKTVKRAQFRSGDESLLLTISEGKSGIFVKATYRENAEAEAKTGVREQFTDMAAAEKAFDVLCKTTEKKGWTRSAGAASRNSFTEIPTPKSAAK